MSTWEILNKLCIFGLYYITRSCGSYGNCYFMSKPESVRPVDMSHQSKDL